MVKKKAKNTDDESVITIPREILRKFVDDAYARGKRDAYKEMRTKTHRTADLSGIRFKSNIVTGEDEEKDERKS